YYVDERRDPEKSVQAAATYLKALYKQFGDWHLALAAYNAGENRIARAIQRTGKRSYWAIARTRHISAETKNYVPKFIAGLIIAKNPNVFGFADLNLHPPLRYEIATLPRGMTLQTAARLAQVPMETIWDLNAELRWKMTPPQKGYPLHLPVGRGEGFLQRLAKAPVDPFPVASRYRIQRGDTFGSIAKRFNISLGKLMELNAQIHPRRLKPGTVVMLAQPQSPQKPQEGEPILAGTSPETLTDTTRYRIQPGDTLGTIASRHQVPLSRIVELNPGLHPRRLRPGTVIRLGLLRTRGPGTLIAKADTKVARPASPSHHIVGSGENAWTISRKYGIPMQEFLRLNRLSASSVIFPGDRLRIRQ
ncbi:MAG: LysM peptidoglycan-binding domain-containing protein, partial [bacterium]|nr:LysM peptidoglycan-binding domain-containing protein [bacterium]